MDEIVKLNLFQFATVYLLLIIVLIIMKKSRVNKAKLLIVASIRMTVQLVLAGFVLTYIFDNPHPVFTVMYILVMTLFAIHIILSKNKQINTRFKIVIALSLAGTGMLIVAFFVGVVVRVDVFNPQYAIPISGMVLGNAMTGISIAIRTFNENIHSQRNKIEALLNIGVTPDRILLPFVNNSLETALLPTLNSMLGMGIVSLPGMMTGQILSGTSPMTAILYQISIMITLCTAVCISVFCSLYFGYRSLYNNRNQIKL